MLIAEFEISVLINPLFFENDVSEKINTATMKRLYTTDLHRKYLFQTPYLSDFIELGKIIERHRYKSKRRRGHIKGLKK
jgi:hypothetical protein